MTDRGSERQSRAEREGVVDQQGAAAEKMGDHDASAAANGGPTAEEPAGVDQQGAVKAAMEDE
jgi:hypothetical protein